MRKILIANRGEIAVRVARTCRRMGIHSVGLFSEADRQALHVSVCDEAHFLGPADPLESYLNIEKILNIAREQNVDAIHPGYGFLSENAAFSNACEKAGFIFIGPSSEAIQALGTKHRAKTLAQKLRIPTIPGYEGDEQSEARLIKEARRLGFPLLIKASSGGGGKGMRMVDSEHQLLEALQTARGEALRYFADSHLILEAYMPKVKHVEIQVMADSHGNIVHGFERDCSLQRRNQKVIEESPCSFLSESMRGKLAHAAISLFKAAHYVGVGTVEFLLDVRNAETFYFLETNTRLQVEHTITEETTGIDLVEWQILIHRGETLPLRQEQLIRQGHAIECRVYAEDPANDYSPSSGVVELWSPAGGEGLRFDSGIQEGQTVPVFYDSLLVKIVSFGPTRDVALQRMQKALRETQLIGVTNNLSFLSAVLEQNDLTADYDTSFISRRKERLLKNHPEKDLHDSLIAGALFRILMRRRQQARLSFLPLAWTNVGEAWGSEVFSIEGIEKHVFYRPTTHRSFLFSFDRKENDPFLVKIVEDSSRHFFRGSDGSLAPPGPPLPFNQKVLNILLDIEGNVRRWFVKEGTRKINVEATLFVFSHHFAGAIQLDVSVRLPVPKREESHGAYLAPMPGKILQVFVHVGREVVKGEPLLTWESMKMEQTLKASHDGTIASVYVQAGDIIAAHTPLIKMEEHV